MLTALLLISLAQSQPGYPPSRERIWRFRTELSGNGTPAASTGSLFSFATASGAGMTAECACGALSSVQGTAVTFARASSGFCTTGSLTQPTSMTLCSTDQPRAMTGGAGAVGLFMEAAATNSTIRSAEFENAAWVGTGSVLAAPTITANAAVAPDGTTTADRIQIGATLAPSPIQYSILYQLASCPTTTVSVSVYLKGNGQSGVINISQETSGTLPLCSFTDGVWTRCLLENVVSTTGIGSFGTSDTGGTSPAVDLFAWGFQCEAGTHATSYIPTTSAAATRAIDNAYIAVGSLAWATVHLSATWVLPTYMSTYQPYQLYIDASNTTHGFAGSAPGTTPAIFTSRFRYAGTSTNVNSAALLAANTTVVVGSYYDGTNIGSCVGSACLTSAQSLTVPSGTYKIYIGSRGDTAAVAHGIIKNLCADPSSCPGAP